MTSRREFLSVFALLLVPRVSRAVSAAGPRHPDPRPGITAAKVLTDSALHSPEAVAAFGMARQIPQVLDGIRCSCGCAGTKGYYSLLTCFEEVGMAQHCIICQGEVKLAFKLHQDGWSLNGIRRSIDAAYAE